MEFSEKKLKNNNPTNESLDYTIENVVATATVQIEEKIELNQIARKLNGVEYNPGRFPGLIMRIEKPRATILVFSTGKMVITGLRDGSEALKVVEKVIKNIKKTGIKVMNPEINIVNIVASGDLHTNIDLNMAAIVLENTMYEPEVFPGIIYRMQEPKAVFLIFSTGRIVCTGARQKEIVKEAIFKLSNQVRELDLTKDTPHIDENADMDFF